MENIRLFTRRNNLLIRIAVLMLLVSLSALLHSQAPADFSGTWVQDSSKSDDFYKKFGITLTITQDEQYITIKQNFYDRYGRDVTSSEIKINLDGKETSKEEYGGINRESASWSADKKVLTTRSTRTVGKNVYGSTTSYTLEENGQALVICTADIINPSGKKMTQYLNRKK